LSWLDRGPAALRQIALDEQRIALFTSLLAAAKRRPPRKNKPQTDLEPSRDPIGLRHGNLQSFRFHGKPHDRSSRNEPAGAHDVSRSHSKWDIEAGCHDGERCMSPLRSSRLEPPGTARGRRHERAVGCHSGLFAPQRREPAVGEAILEKRSSGPLAAPRRSSSAKRSEPYVVRMTYHVRVVAAGIGAEAASAVERGAVPRCLAREPLPVRPAAFLARGAPKARRHGIGHARSI
jgi:hypothetical protein